VQALDLPGVQHLGQAVTRIRRHGNTVLRNSPP
jgi:hypothetical protein